MEFNVSQDFFCSRIGFYDFHCFRYSHIKFENHENHQTLRIANDNKQKLLKL